MSDHDDNNGAGACPPADCLPCPTLCDGDTTNNHWFTEGVCILDTLSPRQVNYILEHNEVARADLLRVTTNPDLIDMANSVPRLPTTEEDDELMKVQAKQTPLPFYQIFRGNLNNM